MQFILFMFLLLASLAIFINAALPPLTGIHPVLRVTCVTCYLCYVLLVLRVTCVTCYLCYVLLVLRVTCVTCYLCYVLLVLRVAMQIILFIWFSSILFSNICQCCTASPNGFFLMFLCPNLI